MKKKIYILLILLLTFPLNVYALDTSMSIGGGGSGDNGYVDGAGGYANYRLYAVPYMKVSLAKISSNSNGKITKVNKIIDYRFYTLDDDKEGYTYGNAKNFYGYVYFMNHLNGKRFFGSINDGNYGYAIHYLGGAGHCDTDASCTRIGSIDNNWGGNYYSIYDGPGFNAGNLRNIFTNEVLKNLLSDFDFFKGTCGNETNNEMTCDEKIAKDYVLLVEPIGAFCAYSQKVENCFWATFKAFAKMGYEDKIYADDSMIYEWDPSGAGFANFIYAPDVFSDESGLPDYSTSKKSYLNWYSSTSSKYGWGIVKLTDLQIIKKEPQLCSINKPTSNTTNKDSSIGVCNSNSSLHHSMYIYEDVISLINQRLENVLKACNKDHGDQCRAITCNYVSVLARFSEYYSLLPNFSSDIIYLYPGSLMQIGYTYRSEATMAVIFDDNDKVNAEDDVKGEDVGNNPYNGNVTAQVVYSDDTNGKYPAASLGLSGNGRYNTYSEQVNITVGYDEELIEYNDTNDIIDNRTIKKRLIDKAKNYFLSDNVISSDSFSVKSSDDDKLESQGKWTCNITKVYENENMAGRGNYVKTVINECTYNLDYLHFNEDFEPYYNSTANNSDGQYYYLNRNYKEKTFSWGITTSNNISRFPSLFNITINANGSNFCSAMVFHNGSNGVDNILKYRSIDVDNPFPKNVLGEEWGIYKKKDSSFSRLKNSYSSSNLHYKVSINEDTAKEISKISTNYDSFDGIDEKTATSSFITSNFSDTTGRIHHCNFGKFGWGCDK